MFKFIPSITVAAGLFTLSILGATSAQAASLKLSTWTSAGDVTKNINSAIITNANANQLDDATASAPTTPVIVNMSSINPLNPGPLETDLGLSVGALVGSAQQGSGIYTDLTVGAGDVFSFDWSIFEVPSLDSTPPPTDRIFAAINGAIFDLTGSDPFSYTFGTAGTFRVGVGVVDQEDILNSSVLSISNADLTKTQAVPSPALLPAMIGFGLSLIRKRRSIG
jgi:hypothetical protein